MDLSVRQTRQLLLAGTVAFPKPFPLSGIISFETGSVINDRDRGPEDIDFLVVQQRTRKRGLVTYTVRPDDVRAVFVPGRRRRDNTFRISTRRWVQDFDRGAWFLGDDVDLDRIVRKLGIDDAGRVQTRESILRGILFVRGTRPVIRSTIEIDTAHPTRPSKSKYCTECWENEPIRCTPEPG